MNRVLGSLLFCVFSATLAVGQAAYPFPQNIQYPNGFMPTTVSSTKMQTWFDAWNAKYPKTCGNAIMPSADSETEAKVEGMGWAMLTAAYMGNKDLYDGILQFYKNKCTSEAGGMMAWSVTCEGFVDRGSATDGDLDVAFSLIVAYWQWGGDYLDQARALITKCRMLIKNCDGVSVLAAGYSGGAWGGCDETDISYYTPAFFRVFADVSGDAAWTKLADDTYTLLARSANPTTGLVPDWQYANGTPGSSSGRETTYRYDACRAPWRLALDYLWNGNEKAKTWCIKISNWANGVGPANIKDGYQLNGTPTGTNHNMAFTGALAVSAMCNSQEMSNAFGAEIAKMTDSYWYNQHLGNVYLLALTGNMWHKDHLGGSGETFPLAITTVGQGTITRDPDAIRYAPGTQVTLTANPESGWAFGSWSGDGVSGSENPLTITVDSEISITANFVVDFDPNDPNSNLLKNGDFSATELAPWVLNAWNNSEATGSATNGAYTVDITALGENVYDLQLVQRNVPLEMGKSYRLTFDASSTVDRTMDIIIQMPDDPWDTYASKTVDLTSAKQTYSVEFTMTGETNLDSRVGFNFGNAISSITISNVRLAIAQNTVISAKVPVSRSLSGLKVNPSANTGLKVNFMARNTGVTLLRIYNLKGDIVETAKLNTTAGHCYTHKFNSGKLSNGYYVLSVNNAGNVEQAKVLISR